MAFSASPQMCPSIQYHRPLSGVLCVSVFSQAAAIEGIYALDARTDQFARKAHVAVVELMSQCVQGMNSTTEALAEQLLPLEFVMAILTDEGAPLQVCARSLSAWTSADGKRKMGIRVRRRAGALHHRPTAPPPPPHSPLFAQVAELAAHHESIIRSHVEDGWSIVYPDGSSEKHPEVGRVGGYGVYFGDHRDVAEFLPVNEPQTNIRGELRAALSALQGHIPGTKSLICPDCQLVVDGVLGLAQRWRRHNWCNTSGDVAHADLWVQILELTERHGTEIKWMHAPSHIGIRGNEKADQLADLGRRKSPLLFGRISVTPRQDDEEEERELLEGEISVWGDEEEPLPRRRRTPPPPAGCHEHRRPRHGGRLEILVRKSLPRHYGMWKCAHQP